MGSRRSHIVNHPPLPGDGEPRQRHGDHRDAHKSYDMNGLAFILWALGVRVAENSRDGRAEHEPCRKLVTRLCQTKPILGVFRLKRGLSGKTKPICTPAGVGDVRQPLSHRQGRACRCHPS